MFVFAALDCPVVACSWYGESHWYVQMPVKKVLATTALRKFNQQWRIMFHHAVPFASSSDAKFGVPVIEVADSFVRRPSSAAKISTSGDLKNGIDAEYFDSTRDRSASGEYLLS
jgi:hypothetical protein